MPSEEQQKVFDVEKDRTEAEIWRSTTKGKVITNGRGRRRRRRKAEIEAEEAAKKDGDAKGVGSGSSKVDAGMASEGGKGKAAEKDSIEQDVLPAHCNIPKDIKARELGIRPEDWEIVEGLDALAALSAEDAFLDAFKGEAARVGSEAAC